MNRTPMGPNGAEPTPRPGAVDAVALELHWYALAVRSRCEKGVAAELLALGVEHYLPLKQERRPWRDRIKTVEMALFPGYVFARVRLVGPARYRIVDLGDVLCVVGHTSERGGLPIPDGELESVRLLAEHASDVESCAALPRGTRVQVAAGPLRGAVGVVEEAGEGKKRIVCAIELLNRAVRTTIDPELLIPIK
ncbi:MAG: transcription termination/antitermination NusG family protein [Pseudomonadota bacterium]